MKRIIFNGRVQGCFNGGGATLTGRDKGLFCGKLGLFGGNSLGVPPAPSSAFQFEDGSPMQFEDGQYVEPG